MYRDEMQITSLYFGGEYALLTKEEFIPFFGGALTANFINSGNTKKESRFGLQLNMGANFTTSKHFGFVGGVKLDFANLFGKESNINKPTSGQLLYDAEHTYNGKQVPSKNIVFIQLYGGFAFFFGQPKQPKE